MTAIDLYLERSVDNAKDECIIDNGFDNWLAKEVVTTQKWDRSGTPETLGIMPFVKITTTNSLVGGTELVSNIGGGLGLVLGLSILSVMDSFL